MTSATAWELRCLGKTIRKTETHKTSQRSANLRQFKVMLGLWLGVLYDHVSGFIDLTKPFCRFEPRSPDLGRIGGIGGSGGIGGIGGV